MFSWHTNTQSAESKGVCGSVSAYSAHDPELRCPFFVLVITKFSGCTDPILACQLGHLPIVTISVKPIRHDCSFCEYLVALSYFMFDKLELN
jgi:hypothetical protein